MIFRSTPQGGQHGDDLLLPAHDFGQKYRVVLGRGIEGLANVIKYVSEHPEINAFGGWYNSDNNMYYFDATVIVNDLEAAKELGRINKQIAIFDLANLTEIRL